MARERCFKYQWVVDLDIHGFFDSLEHERIMSMLEAYTEARATHLYAKRFLAAEAIDASGCKQKRDKGTPQGGVISPLLANLYLHEAFDSWMQEKFSELPFERYADDKVVHCVSEKQAYFIKNRIEGRLKLFGLTLYPEKTKVS